VPGTCPLCGSGVPRSPVATGKDFEYGVTGQQEFQFVRCDRCGTMLLDPRPADDEIAGLYPPSYEPYRFDSLPAPIRAGRGWAQRAKVRVVRRIAKSNASVVDVGCGAGGFLRLLRQRGDSTWRLSGWDYPSAPLDRLAQEGFHVVSAPLTAEHVPRGTDVFVLNQVIEHFPRPDEIVGVLADALAPGGHLVLETPDIAGFDARWFRARYWGGYHFPRHLVLFDGPGLRRLVERAGLRVVETAHLASPAFWVQSVHHLLLESPMSPLARTFSIGNLPLVGLVTGLDLLAGRFGPTSNQRLIAIKD
jgi:SAM-dependent methyltransferase